MQTKYLITFGLGVVTGAVTLFITSDFGSAIRTAAITIGGILGFKTGFNHFNKKKSVTTTQPVQVKITSQEVFEMPSLTKLLKQATIDGVITCPKCGNSLEPDAKLCVCGWKNPLPEGGWI